MAFLEYCSIVLQLGHLMISDDVMLLFVVVGRIFCFVIHLNQPIHSKKTETMQSNKKMGCVREGLIVTCEKMCDSHTLICLLIPSKTFFAASM